MKRFRSVHIPNLIPVRTVLLHLIPLLPVFLHTWNFTTLIYSATVWCHILTSANPVPHDLLLPTLNDCWLPAGYTSWWRSNLTNRVFYVCYWGALTSPYEVLSGVPQGSDLLPHIFNKLFNYLCSVLRNSNGLPSSIHINFSEFPSRQLVTSFTYNFFFMDGSLLTT